MLAHALLQRLRLVRVHIVALLRGRHVCCRTGRLQGAGSKVAVAAAGGGGGEGEQQPPPVLLCGSTACNHPSRSIKQAQSPPSSS